MSTIDMTPDEINDALREIVERDLPTPANGFETDEMNEIHRERHDARFMELVHNLPANL